jgi:hypothetical protein
LLYSCPRTATVVAKYDCKLWVITRRAFRGITAQHKKRRLELKLEFLKKVSGYSVLLVYGCMQDVNDLIPPKLTYSILGQDPR